MLIINNVCALVICYKDYEATSNCIKSIQLQTHAIDTIYVVDNTENPDVNNEIYNMDKVEVLKSSGNLGISGAYYLAFQYALSQGKEWCWTFDQDSVARENALEELLNNSKHIKANNVGILASTGISKKNGSLYKGNNASWLRLQKPNYRNSVYKCDLVISAGSLTNLNYFKQFGYSFKDMFIDWVDFEICIDMNRHGYSIYSCQTSFFDHYIGGDEEADYAESEDDADAISDLRLTYLAKNSLKVILESKSKLKYPYLLFHLFKLIKHTDRKQRSLLFKTVKRSLLNYINNVDMLN
ncbi:MAG: glycosyltransferase [Colwellia sp.]|jgi:Predicted glycosyltransferases